MIVATNRAERIADRIQRIVCFFLGNPTSKLSQALVPYFHSRREYIITTDRWHTSHAYHYETGKPEWIPKGEKMTLYFWRGFVYRVWNGEITSIDASIEEGLPHTNYGSEGRYNWDMSKYG